MSFSQKLRQLGQPIAYYPQLAKPLGGVTAAILFGQLFFWQDKTSNPLGVYKTQAELEQETGLSRREQETARKKLVELGILVETHKRLEHRIYFKLDLVKFDALMDDIREEAKPPLPNATNEHSPMAESDIREEAKPPFVNTENTSENTNNNTSLTGSINAREKKSADLILLESFGITEQLAKDFIVHRKSFKAPITETALKGFQREADKAKIPIQQAIAISIERGWRGFNAGWDWQNDGVSAKNPQNPPARNTSKPFIPDDEGNWAEGMSITLRGS
ncbi:DNA replication protein [Glaesserella parasuis]|uniref:DNA replication protein n=1 Tax=Glaesserella parasuis TaxID=738 RepID=UPI001A93DCC5|nr:DNA replication protein [Glaesserella parasuis]MDG6283310.1 DNA replication protein [Glaesserella parasuis]MDO9953003.1 DNA replication protein [Glaesserella parasuis]MDO9989423.1 DNA replication protein [Glaesserella parasuis]MDP0006164.1 DNA replication protein [Glaesserella parasuis]MDP0025195.1 DNA replication protein [Glaesserella parasuis]